MRARSLDKIAGILDFLRKPKTTALALRKGSDKLNKLVDSRHVNESFLRELKRKPLRDALIGATVGTVGGGLVPVDAPDKLTEEQEARNKELEDWYNSLSYDEKHSSEAIKRMMTEHVRTARQKRATNAITGMLVGGLGTGALSRTLRGMRVSRLAAAYDEAIPGILREVVPKSPASGPYPAHGPNPIRFGQRIERDILSRAKEMILKNKDPITADNDIFFGAPSYPRDEAYAAMMKEVNRERPFYKVMPDAHRRASFVGVDRAGEKLRRQFVNSFQRKLRELSDQDVSVIMNRLKSEGITDARAFVNAYHPDRNKNVPKEILSNFGEVLSRFREGELEDLVRGAVNESNARVDYVNSRLEPILIKNWKPSQTSKTGRS